MFYESLSTFSSSMARPFLELVMTEWFHDNSSKIGLYIVLLFIEAIAYELHIYFGQYYQFQTRAVQCSESRTERLLRVRVLTVIPSQYA